MYQRWDGSDRFLKAIEIGSESGRLLEEACPDVADRYGGTRRAADAEVVQYVPTQVKRADSFTLQQQKARCHFTP